MCENSPAFTSWEDGLLPEWELLAGMKDYEKYFENNIVAGETFFFFLLSHTITFSCLSNFVDLFSVSNLKLVE